MQHTHISRRRFALLAGTAGVAPLGLVGAAPLTAEDAIKSIQSALGGDWSTNGLDGFKAGPPSTQVKGIATTAMATMDVLKMAVKENTNLVLTFEPTFYGRADGNAQAAFPGRGTPGRGGSGRGAQGRGPAGIGPDDPVVKAKHEFIEKNNLVVFRLRDHWLASRQNDMVAGLASALGWSSHRVKSDDALYNIPPANAEEIVALIRRKLKLRAGLRAVGDRKAAIRRVLLYPGEMGTATMWKRYTEVDMIVAGEVREWENTHYAADIYTAGEKRALVLTGRVASEEPGMRACADWLKTVLKDVPAKWIDAGDPYWRPA